jgi:hypothetical protein
VVELYIETISEGKKPGGRTMDEITQFPKVITGINWETHTFNNHPEEEEGEETEMPKPPKPEKKKPVIIEAMPGESLPENCPDYRSLLQRDGLILHSWEIYGDDIKIVWLSANRGMFKYQAWADDDGDLPSICPENKYSENRSYYRTDEEPDFIIYAAPPGLTASTRSAFVARLKAAGISVNFDYEFSLGRQKAAREAAVLDRIGNSQNFFSPSGTESKNSMLDSVYDFINELHDNGTVSRWEKENKWGKIE